VLSSTSDQAIPPLAICILVTGTRGDVQPFIALGLGLKAAGHRIRLATHAPYRDFVEGFGLEFYPLGGDPKVLSEYVVKNRGIFTNSVAEVMAQRKQLKAIIHSTYPACTEPDPEHPDMPFTVSLLLLTRLLHSFFRVSITVNVH
jgi:sterol 3beta-glucosyltransferase